MKELPTQLVNYLTELIQPYLQQSVTHNDENFISKLYGTHS